ncbi:MAG: hypothetical protein S4CHLAM37_06330 [Chlamydiia bacterium]|nr:hypothetical protein [Chlamydiia bacterium]
MKVAKTSSRALLLERSKNLELKSTLARITVTNSTTKDVTTVDLTDLFWDKDGVAKSMLVISTNTTLGPVLEQPDPTDTEVYAVAKAITGLFGSTKVVVFSKNADESSFWNKFGFVKANREDGKCTQMTMDKTCLIAWKGVFEKVVSDRSAVSTA